MKKILAVFIVFSFVFICGCEENQSVKVNFNNMKFTCKISQDTESFCMDFDVKDDKITASVTKPEEICGMTYSLAGDKIYEEYKGVKTEKILSKANGENIVAMIFGVIKDCNGKTAKRNEENYLLSVDNENTKYYLWVSPSGLPLKLELSDSNINAVFENLTLVK